MRLKQFDTRNLSLAILSLMPFWKRWLTVFSMGIAEMSDTARELSSNARRQKWHLNGKSCPTNLKALKEYGIRPSLSVYCLHLLLTAFVMTAFSFMYNLYFINLFAHSYVLYFLVYQILFGFLIKCKHSTSSH